MNLESGAHLGPYEIIARAGAGGMGEVYKARDRRLNRLVALKVLPPDKVTDPERRRRFLQEAQAASALNHPNIVTIHDIGQENGIDFIVMEFVTGKTLAERISLSPFTNEELLSIAGQLADALAAAHAVGITHRDLKPANIILAVSKAIKVLDFGLAKLARASEIGPADSTVTSAETEAGVVMGTFSYMSPEQAQGRKVDARSDIFSFGSVLYEMAAGRRAFHGDSPLSALTAVLRDEPKPLPASVPARIQRIIARCLRKEPAERFQNAFDIKAALLEGAPEAATETTSIAVLPLVNMNHDQETEFLSDGIAEDIINALMKVPGLRVAARSSAFQFKGASVGAQEVGQRLKVGAILEGSLRKAGGRLRISVQLINATDGFQMWSERFDRILEDIFDVQDEISQTIVRKLQLKLAGGQTRLIKRATNDFEAYQLYVIGRQHWHRRTVAGFNLARAHFEAAIARDPEFALPHVGIADWLLSSGFHGAIPWRGLQEQAAALLDKALELDDTLGEAYASRAYLLGAYRWDFAEAEAAFQKAVALTPNNDLAYFAYSVLCLYPTRRFVEAMRVAENAIELDPLRPLYYSCLGFIACGQRNYAEAHVLIDRGLQLDPDYPLLTFFKGCVFCYEEQFAEGISLLEKSVAQLSPGGFWGPGMLGFFYGRAGRVAEARAVLARLERLRLESHVQTCAIAEVHLGLGDRDTALQWLERAFEERDRGCATWGLSRSGIRFATILATNSYCSASGCQPGDSALPRWGGPTARGGLSARLG